MSQEELFRTVTDVLQRLNIPYMLTGSVASSFYGEPRSTHDIDFVIVLRYPDIQKLVESFAKDRYYISEEAIKESITRETPFNLIDSHTGLKADFWPVKSDPYHQLCFERRKTHTIFGRDAHIATPEDLIILKLEWSKLSGGSGVQFKDALSIYEVQKGNLDLEYIRRWAEGFSITELVDKMIEQSAL